MRHTHTFIIAKLSCKPPGDLLWRPVQSQLLCHQAGQLRVFGQVALLGPQSSIPSTLIRDMSSVPPPLRAVTRNLPADTRGRSPKAPRDLADRSVSAKPTRNLLSLRKSQGSSRTTAYSRRDAPMRSNDPKERICLLVHPPRHLGKRLACLPPLPYLNPCFNRQPRTTTHVQPPNPLQAGSCCIDRLRSPLKLVRVATAATKQDEWWVQTAFPLGALTFHRKLARGELHVLQSGPLPTNFTR